MVFDHIQFMKLICTTTWKNVFADWRLREANDPGWIKCATETKGWPDWESWRLFTASQLGLPNLTWQIFEFIEPMEEVPAMLLGPFTGWQSRVSQPNSSSFADLVEIPEQLQYWQAVGKVQRIIQQFPCEAAMVGVVRPDSSKIVCIEGHHRAVAVAVARALGQTVSFSKPVRIALAKLPAGGSAILDATLARGSSKEPTRA